MKNYKIYVKEVHEVMVDVQALSKKDAIRLIQHMQEQGEMPYDYIEYSHTLPPEQWDVIEYTAKDVSAESAD